MIDIFVYDTALKVTWVRREITGNHDWCKLFRQETVRGQFIWERNSSSLLNLAKKTSNTFWAEVMIAMAQYDRSIDAEIDDIGRHSVWFSNHTKFKNSEIKSWKQKGIIYINDLLKDNGMVMSFEEAKTTYEIRGTRLDYMGLVNSLPDGWKNWQGKRKEIGPIIHPNVQNTISQKQGTKCIYDILIGSKYKDDTNSWEAGWEQELGQINWTEVYKLNKKFISVTYQTLQYKILTKIVATNRLLYQMGIKESYNCDRCTESIDSIMHKFWSCSLVRTFWSEVAVFLRDKGLIQNISAIDKKVVILGCLDSPIVNHVIIVCKKMMANNYLFSIENLLRMLKIDMETERRITNKKGKICSHDNKWANLEVALR